MVSLSIKIMCFHDFVVVLVYWIFLFLHIEGILLLFLPYNICFIMYHGVIIHDLECLFSNAHKTNTIFTWICLRGPSDSPLWMYYILDVFRFRNLPSQSLSVIEKYYWHFTMEQKTSQLKDAFWGFSRLFWHITLIELIEDFSLNA